MTKTAKIRVGRYINGVVLNPLEYVLDDNGKIKLFNSKTAAKKWLKSKGATRREIEGFVYEEVEA